MGTSRGWALAAVAALSGAGCAVIAGYDFGKYSESGGVGGAGGQPASGSVASGFVTSSGFGGTSTSGSSSSSAGQVTTSSSSSGRPSSSSTTSASSSGLPLPSSSSSGVWGTSSSASSSSSSSGVVVTLLSGLVGPEAVAVDTQLVYYTTNNPPAGPSTVGWTNKDGTKSGISVAGVTGAPAVAAAGTGSPPGYAVTWTNNEAGMPTGTIYSFLPGTANVLGGVMDSTLGVAQWGSTVFFTTTGSKVWSIPQGSNPQNFAQWPEPASGPIVADATGVFWPTVQSHMVQSDLGGAKAISLCTVPDPAVYAVATDASYVYWTDQSGGVYQVLKGGGAALTTLNGPDPNGAVPAYGIAVDPATSTVYFAQGTQVYRATFPFMGHAPVPLPAPGLQIPLVAPRGVAFDGSYVYVADKGNSDKLMPNGRILRFPK